MYIALNYIGGQYTPGEIIPDDLPKEKLDWWKKTGAIKEVAPEDEGLKAKAENLSVAAVTSPLSGETTEETVEEAEDEIDEEAEAPEIDIMDGLVTTEEEPKKPARTRSKTAKGGKAK